jgi:nicotinamide-nucleotide amidase
MFPEQCMPRLARLLPPQVIRTRFFRVAGMGESDLDQKISPAYKSFSNPVTTILAGAGDIQIHLRARGATAEETEAALAAVAPKIEELLGDRIYSHDGAPLEEVVGRLLAASDATVAVAESCTGGILGERISSVVGSSKYFLGGVLTYTNEMKIALLGVAPEILERHTAVSAQTAIAMAKGARERTGATWAVSVTGEAGPESATGAPPGTVYIGIAGPNGAPDAQHYLLFGGRDGVRARAAQWALDLLRKKLIEA